MNIQRKGLAKREFNLNKSERGKLQHTLIPVGHIIPGQLQSISTCKQSTEKMEINVGLLSLGLCTVLMWWKANPFTNTEETRGQRQLVREEGGYAVSLICNVPFNLFIP